MRCGPQSHVYQWPHTATGDAFPPDGTHCLCGGEVFYRAGGTSVTVGDKGRCDVCKQPIDDHPGARACAV